MNINQAHASISFELFLDIVTVIGFSVMSYYALTTYTAYDTLPVMIPATAPELISKTEKAPLVETGIYIHDFTEFDIVQGRFLVDLALWFRFDPKKISIDAIDQFTFEKAEIKSKSEPMMAVVDSHLFVYYTMRVLFELPLNYRTFPFDDHHISFTLINEKLGADKIKLDQTKDNIVLNPEMHVDGWRIKGKSVHIGYGKTDIMIEGKEQEEFHPRAVFTLEFGRTSARHLISIFLPLLLIFFISLFSFSFAIDEQEAKETNLIDLSSSSIFGIVAYRFVIETMSPSVGYFMLSDYIFVFFLLMGTFILFLNSVVEGMNSLQKNMVVLGRKIEIK